MPLYTFTDSAGHVLEELRPVGTTFVICACGRTAERRPSTFALGNPPTGAGVRGMFRRFTEASAEMDHAYTKAETDLERPLPGPKLWQAAKAKAAAMIDAGEAPPLAPLNQ